MGRTNGNEKKTSRSIEGLQKKKIERLCGYVLGVILDFWS